MKLLGLGALAAIAVGVAAAVGWDRGSTDVRVVLQRHDDGRIEVGVEERTDDGWSDPILPEARFVGERHDRTNVWYRSSPVTVGKSAPQPNPDQLTIAMLTFPGGTGRERIKTFKLAIEQINAAGGVNGTPVLGVIGDSAGTRPDHTVITARRLVEDEDADVIVGGAFSSNTLAVVEAVSAPMQIPTISPSATSPLLTTAADSDFFFRAVLSDTWQGPALADLVRDLGYTNVGIIYINDAWGTGLFGTFREAYDGALTSAEVDPAGTSFLDELRALAAGGAQALVVLAFSETASVIISDSVEHGLFDQFVFGDGGQSVNIPAAVGAEIVAGMRGTAPYSPDSESTALWRAAHVSRWGSLSDSAFIASVYDATIAFALAAQAAGSTDGVAIRDQLRRITDPNGLRVIASVESLRAGLAELARGGTVNYIAVGFQLDWDEFGDLEPSGAIAVWEFTEDGGYRTVE